MVDARRAANAVGSGANASISVGSRRGGVVMPAVGFTFCP